MDEVLFVSSNQWDVAGAYHAGLDVIWLNRKDESFEDLGHLPLSKISTLDNLSQLI